METISKEVPRISSRRVGSLLIGVISVLIKVTKVSMMVSIPKPVRIISTKEQNKENKARKQRKKKDVNIHVEQHVARYKVAERWT